MAKENSEVLDPVRSLIVRLAQEQRKSLLTLSKALGRNHAYLQQFVRLQVPRRLPEDVRRALGRLLGVDPRLLQPPEERELPPLRQPGEPIDVNLMHEALAITNRLVKGDSPAQKFRHTEMLGFVIWLLERQAAGVLFDLRDENLLARLEALSYRMQHPPA